MILRKQHNYCQLNLRCRGRNDGQYPNKFARVDAQGLRVCDNHRLTQQLLSQDTFLI